jgi:hypothetical protein
MFLVDDGAARHLPEGTHTVPYGGGLTLVPGEQETPPALAAGIWFALPSPIEGVMRFTFRDTPPTPIGVVDPTMVGPAIQFVTVDPAIQFVTVDPAPAAEAQEAPEEQETEEDDEDEPVEVVVPCEVEDVLAMIAEEQNQERAGRMTSSGMSILSPPEMWDGKGQAKFLSVVEEVFSPLGIKSIRVVVPNGMPETPEHFDHELNILVWSTPAADACLSPTPPPAKLWGKAVDCLDNTFAPSGMGTVIALDGKPLLEYVAPNALYFLWDAVHLDTEASLTIFRKALQAFVTTVGEENLKRTVSGIEEARRERARKAVRDLITASLTHERKGLKVHLEKLEKRIIELHQNLVLSLREKLEKTRLLEGFSEDDVQERVSCMLRDIYKLKGVKDVRFEASCMKVYTNMMFVTDPRTRRVHQLGEFELTLTVSSDSVPKMMNLTHQVRAYSGNVMQAPHVFRDGNPCLGDLVQSLPEVQARHDYVTLASLCMMFLQSVNTDDAAGKYVHHWPRLEEDGSFSEWSKRPEAERVVCGVN